MSPIDLMPTPSGAQFPTVETVPRENLTAFLTAHLETPSTETSGAKSRDSAGPCRA